MAISKYSYDSGKIYLDPTAMLVWFNSHKTGTVFETATFTSTKIDDHDYDLTFTLGEDEVLIKAWDGTYSKTPSDNKLNVMAFNQTPIINIATANNNYANSDSYLRDVIMCKYGLILGWVTGTGPNSALNTNPYSLHTPLLLTVDNNNNLAVVTPYSDPIGGYNIPTTSIGTNEVSVEILGYCLRTADSEINNPQIIPTSTGYATSLQRFTTFDSSGNGIYTPFAYYATSTQFIPNNESEVAGIIMNSIRYITNGRWYVQDAD